MKKLLFYIFLIQLLISCGQNKSPVRLTVTDTLTTMDSVKGSMDTDRTRQANIAGHPYADFEKIDSNTYSFSIGDSELLDAGTEGKAYYKQYHIDKIDWVDFGCTGQRQINYLFLKNKTILLSEKDFVYPDGIGGRLEMIDSIRCTLDTNGNQLDKKRIDSTTAGIEDFSDIKRVVPFKIGN